MSMRVKEIIYRKLPVCLSLFLGIVFMNVESVNAGNIDGDLESLSRASSFSYGGMLNQASRNETFACYQRLCQNWQSLEKEQLNKMLNSATPAGKLYAAALISESNCFRGKPGQMKYGFSKLEKDNSEVVFRSGCLVSKHTVAEIAGSFMKENRFQDFCLSGWCEKPIADPGSAPAKNMQVE